MGKPVAKLNISDARKICFSALHDRELSSKRIADQSRGSMRAIQCALLEMYNDGIVTRRRCGNEYVYSMIACEHEDMECDDPHRCPCDCESCLEEFDRYLSGEI